MVWMWTRRVALTWLIIAASVVDLPDPVGPVTKTNPRVSDVNFTSQAVTPLTARTSRYFFSWGPHCKHGDAALRDVLMGIAGRAFNEDKVMIEAQQEVIDQIPAPDIMPTTADKGITIFTQVMRRLSREDKAVGATAPPVNKPAAGAAA